VCGTYAWCPVGEGVVCVECVCGVCGVCVRFTEIKEEEEALHCQALSALVA
jgi:hypothetical protein